MNRLINLWHIFLERFGIGGNPPGPRFVIHNDYQLDIPFRQYDPRRPFRILSYLQGRRLLRRGMVRQPRPASLKRLQLIHDPEYLHSLEEPGALESVVGESLDVQDQDHYLGFQRIMCGGTLRATQHALARSGVAVNLGGGMHHAYSDRGSGFCVFNDVAVAIASLRRRDKNFPILVIDLDLHDGDGTRAIFADDPSVHTFSIHNQDLGDTDVVASTCIALGADVGDEQYLSVLKEHLPRVIAEVDPGLVFYLAGSDPGISDRLGNWRISLEGMLTRDRFVMELLGYEPSESTLGVRRETVRDEADASYPDPFSDRSGTVPCVILLAGGYGRQAWRHGAAFFSWLISGNSNLDIPLDLELPISRYRRLARLMDISATLSGKPSSDGRAEAEALAEDWGLSEEDLDPAAGPRDSNFLGLFSRHGIELAFEEAGLMDRLREMGFKQLQVGLDLDDPLGHTLRVLTGDDTPLVVLEIRLRVDRSSDPGRSLLSVEWLLIQDTRSRFELSRPLLPGQTYPGLGLLRDTAAVLVVICERLDLDGITFTPSHFHLASLARPVGYCADPVAEARFHAVRSAVKGLHLDEAATAVEGGLIRNQRTGRSLVWEPARLVIPVTEQMKRHFDSQEYQQQVADSAAEFVFCLVSG